MTAPREELNAPAIVTMGAVAAILMFVGILLLQTWSAGTERAAQARQLVSQPVAELAAVRAVQEGQLRGYRWVDARQGTVAIPIERAMELVARELPHHTASE